jgi:hypothetical protein
VRNRVQIAQWSAEAEERKRPHYSAGKYCCASDDLIIDLSLAAPASENHPLLFPALEGCLQFLLRVPPKRHFKFPTYKVHTNTPSDTIRHRPPTHFSFLGAFSFLHKSSKPQDMQSSSQQANDVIPRAMAPLLQRLRAPPRTMSLMLHAAGLFSFAKSFEYLHTHPNPINQSYGWHFQYLTILGSVVLVPQVSVHSCTHPSRSPHSYNHFRSSHFGGLSQF